MVSSLLISGCSGFNQKPVPVIDCIKITRPPLHHEAVAVQFLLTLNYKFIYIPSPRGMSNIVLFVLPQEFGSQRLVVIIAICTSRIITLGQRPCQQACCLYLYDFHFRINICLFHNSSFYLNTNFNNLTNLFFRKKLSEIIQKLLNYYFLAIHDVKTLAGLSNLAAL